MGYSSGRPLVGWAKSLAVSFPRGHGARTIFAHASTAKSRAFAHPTGDTPQHEADRTLSHLPLLRRLLPGVAVSLWFRLEAQVSPFLAVARAIAENLLLAGEVLRRTMDARGAVPGRRLHAEIRVDEVRARQRDEIGAAGGDDGVDLVRGRDRADAHGRERGLVADLIGKRRLEHAAEDGLRVGDG